MSNTRGGSRPGSGKPKKGQEKTSNSKFTSKQLKELLDSPYITFVSKNTISYSSEFKNLFWQRFCDGVSPLQIFKDAGLDSDALTISRVTSFVKLLSDQKLKGKDPLDDVNLDESLSTLYSCTTKIKKGQISQQTLAEKDIIAMAHKVEYMSQELEFLKKIILADKQ